MMAGKTRTKYSGQCLLVGGDTLEYVGLVATDRPDDTNVFSRFNEVDEVVINGNWGSQ